MIKKEEGWISRYTELALLKLACSGEKGETLNGLFRAMNAFVDLALTKEQQLEELSTLLDPLVSTGECTAKGVRRTLSASLREKTLSDFGVRGAVTWPQVQKAEVIVRALTLPDPNASQKKILGTAGGLRAVVLRGHYDLKMTPFPTLPSVREALAWRALAAMRGIEDRYGGRKKFGSGPVLGVMLGSLLGQEDEVEPKKALEKLAQLAVEADKPDPTSLRRRITRNWIFGPGESTASRFAEGVLRAARRCRSGRFGEDKVFISHVFQELAREGSPYAESEESFKRSLIDAYRSERLSLSRADLVEAMPRDDVEQSEIQWGEAQFHFIRIHE